MQDPPGELTITANSRMSASILLSKLFDDLKCDAERENFHRLCESYIRYGGPLPCFRATPTREDARCHQAGLPEELGRGWGKAPCSAVGGFGKVIVGAVVPASSS